jgi:hypothetical protein
MKQLGRVLLHLLAFPGHFTIYGFGLTVHVPLESSAAPPSGGTPVRSPGAQHSYAFAAPSVA